MRRRTEGGRRRREQRRRLRPGLRAAREALAVGPRAGVAQGGEQLAGEDAPVAVTITRIPREHPGEQATERGALGGHRGDVGAQIPSTIGRLARHAAEQRLLGEELGEQRGELVKNSGGKTSSRSCGSAKSVSTGLPSRRSRTLSGQIRPCTTPALCTMRRVSQSSTPRSTTVATSIVRRPARAASITQRRLTPSTNSSASAPCPAK